MHQALANVQSRSAKPRSSKPSSGGRSRAGALFLVCALLAPSRGPPCRPVGAASSIRRVEEIEIPLHLPSQEIVALPHFLDLIEHLVDVTDVNRLDALSQDQNPFASNMNRLLGLGMPQQAGAT